MSSKPHMKPCPFCGNKNLDHDRAGDYLLTTITCECGCEMTSINLSFATDKRKSAKNQDKDLTDAALAEDRKVLKKWNGRVN